MTKTIDLTPTWVGKYWYGKYRIYLDPQPPAAPGWEAFNYAFVHDDFDGAPDSGDNRCGNGRTLQECLDQIDELEAEQ